MTKLLTLTKQSMTLLLALALAFSSSLVVALDASAQSSNVQVFTTKYIDGELATAESADNVTFHMQETYNATNTGSHTGVFSISANDDEGPYQDSSSELAQGASYSSYEVMDSSSGEDCDAGAPYALVGYTTGDTLAQAASMTPTSTAPSFTNMTTDKHIIVWNETCDDSNPDPDPDPEPTPYVKVTIKKYVDGTMATASSADNTDFQISATWDSENTGSGSGTFALSENGSGGSPTPYQAVTAYMESGADYSLHEVMDDNVGADCDAGKPFALEGYTTGNTLAQAQAGTPSDTAPSFTNFTNEKYVIVWNETCEDEEPENSTVTIVKYVDGELATASNASNTTFTMHESWDADNIGSGNGDFQLGASNSPAYHDSTADMSGNASYSVHEVMNDYVGANCDAGKPFALEGYTVGNTLAQAASMTPTTTAPSYDNNLNGDKYVIVWNETCDDENPDEDVTVTIVKYIDGALATDSSSDNNDFQMVATWNADNIGSGTGQYALSGDNQTAYQAVTAEMSNGADYATHEVMDSVTGANCEAGQEFKLRGYTTGDTLAQAAAATISTTSPSFTDLDEDKYVIVWNEDCDDEDPNNEGEIGGEVTGPEGALDVTSIETLDGTGSADGTFENGWEYAFYITVPSDETDLAMKFADWTRNGGGGTIPAAGNIRISSSQANNGGATVTVSGANTYTSPELTMTGDLNPSLPGLQVRVLVEVAIPEGTPNGSYTTTYGVRTE